MIETFHLKSISLIFMIMLVSVTDVTQKGHHFSFAMFNFGFVGKYKSKKYKFTMSCSSSLYLHVSLVVNLNYISLFTCSQAIIDRYGRYAVSLRTLHPLHYTRNNTWYSHIKYLITKSKQLFDVVEHGRNNISYFQWYVTHLHIISHIAHFFEVQKS